MKRLCVSIVTCALFVSCGNNSKTTVHREGDGPLPPTPPPAQKLEPGEDLSFKCLDAEQDTTVQIDATWQPPLTKWSIVLEERDNSGDLITKKDNLLGVPDDFENYQMNISEGPDIYARLIQVSDIKTVYLDRKRQLNCAFN